MSSMNEWVFQRRKNRKQHLPDFIVTQEIINKISNVFDVPEERVRDLYENSWKIISEGMKRHYLAHVIRTMEEELRKLPGNDMFQICCTPVAEDSRDIGIASAHYYKGRYFSIYYHPKTDGKQLRIMLAHELGHLFLLELINTAGGYDYNIKTQIEPISTIMGIFTILDKNEFYHNKTVPFKHTSPDDVIKDFTLLLNRRKNIINIS